MSAFLFLILLSMFDFIILNSSDNVNELSNCKGFFDAQVAPNFSEVASTMDKLAVNQTRNCWTLLKLLTWVSIDILQIYNTFDPLKYHYTITHVISRAKSSQYYHLETDKYFGSNIDKLKSYALHCAKMKPQAYKTDIVYAPLLLWPDGLQFATNHCKHGNTKQWRCALLSYNSEFAQFAPENHWYICNVPKKTDPDSELEMIQLRFLIHVK